MIKIFDLCTCYFDLGMKILLFFAVFLGISSYITHFPIGSTVVDKQVKNNVSGIAAGEESSKSQQLYHTLNLSGTLDFEIFEAALAGYMNLKHNLKNKNIISIIDFTRPSTKKRMYVIDLANEKLLYHTIVSHGKNSGDLYANKFSNRNGSHQSSLGFYITENTYQGRNGYSLVLNGLEKGINDQAKPRAVVIHGADYCSDSFIKRTGRLGRSYGCPALPQELNGPIVNTIKNGSMLFIYGNDDKYLATSKYINNSNKTILASSDILDNSTKNTM